METEIEVNIVVHGPNISLYAVIDAITECAHQHGWLANGSYKDITNTIPPDEC